MRTCRLSQTAVAVSIVSALLIGACGDDTASSPAAPTTTTASGGAGSTTTTVAAGPLDVDSQGTSTISPDLVDQLPPAAAALSASDRASLVYMREEERLALDVYTALYQKWGLQIFDNIGKAEATHTESVKTLLDRYGIADPTLGRTAGTYASPQIQALYDALVAKGSTSIVAALQVGAEIEELDIKDLRDRATSVPDIALVYANLEKGSRNHFRSFTSQLSARGVAYLPVHLSPTDVAAILGTGIERGQAR